MFEDSPGEASSARRHFASLFFAVLLGLAISLGAFSLVRQWEHERVERTFETQARNHGRNLTVTLHQYEEALYTLRDIFVASEDVTFAEFHSGAADLRERHPGIQTLEWLQLISREQRAEVEAHERREIAPDFQIKEGSLPVTGDTLGGDLHTADERAEYLADLYLEPLRGQESLLGYDHLMSPYQREIARARELGQIAASRRVSLRGDAPGWFLFLAVYGPGPNSKSSGERPTKFRGCLKGCFRFSDLITTTIDEADLRSMELMLVDHSPATTEHALISLSAAPAGNARPPSEKEFRSGLNVAVRIPVGGRDWEALFRPTPAWLASQGTRYAYAFLAAGLLLTALLVSGMRGAQQRSAEIRKTVALRTTELRATQDALREDIRQRSAVERALRESDERYRAFIAHSSEAIWRFEFDPPLKISQPVDQLIDKIFSVARLAECNDAFARMYGFQQAGEMIGLTLGGIMPRTIPANLEHMRKYVRNHFRLEGEESHGLDRSGAVRIFLNNVTGIVEDGRLHRTWGTQRDVTEQREAENARRENEARLRLALAAADVGTWEWHPASGSLIFSEETERICGLRAGSFDGRANAAAALVHPEDLARVAAAAQIAVQDGTEYHAEHRIIRPDGSVRWVVERGDVIRGSGDQPARLVGAVMDVTAEHRRAEEKMLLEKKLQETQKLESLGILAGGIAHDFNNLLTGILGNASLARMDLPASSPVQASLEAIENVSQRAAELCKQMLAYSGKGRFVVHQLDLSALVKETAELIQVSIAKNAVLKYSLSETLPAIAADATQIRQIIMNLVINASEAIGERNGLITIHTGVQQADRSYLAETHLSPDLPGGEYVFLEVSDNGSGMDTETQERIFDPFFTTKFTGRGLGLAAVLGIVRGHSGALRVYSEQEKGSTFKLLLPAIGGALEEIAVSGAPVPEWRTSGLVLVVDDEEVVRRVTTRMLENWGFITRTAGNGREAVAQFQVEPERFSAVLLDLTMPEMDGTATFSELRRIRPDVFVLLMSGFNEQDAVSRFAGKGLAGFLQKPFKPEALQAKLRAMLEAPTFSSEGGE